jgi:porin
MRRIRNLMIATTCFGASLYSGSAAAAPPAASLPSTPEGFETGGFAGQAGPFAFLADIDRTNYLLGDMWGLRPLLSKYGMSLAITETSEILGNATGGIRRGAEYDGLTQVVLQLDTQRAFGWYGGTFNASALDIHGRNLSADNLLSLQTASGIEADRALRLWELWYDQKIGGEGRYDVKIGQQSLDQEFMVSQNASYFVNTMFGWPMLPSADLPGGGPAYPLSAPGIRLRVRPFDEWTVLAGVFSGSPVATNVPGDPQRQNPSGLSIPWNGTLAIAELQYSYPAPGSNVTAAGSESLARTYKIGIWYDTKGFADQEVDNTGLSLANPASTGIPRMHQGDWAIYAVLDQMIWQDAEEPDKTLNVFLRPMGTPLADRNLIDFSLNAGLTLHEPLPHRADDTFAIGMGYAHVSRRAAALDQDTALYTGAFTPIRNGETYVEATYQYQVTPWLMLQPDFQYVFNPGAGIVNPAVPTRKVGDEAVLGLRTTIQF